MTELNGSERCGSEQCGEGFLLWCDCGDHVHWTYQIGAYTSPFWGTRDSAIEGLENNRLRRERDGS